MNQLTETEVRTRIKQYFGINELVGGRTYRQHGERAWRYLDYRLLYALLIIREGIGKPMSVNARGMQQRGLRTTAQEMIQRKVRQDKLYVSAHLLGKAVDCDVKGMTAKQVRDWIRENADLFPFKIRIEGGVSWVHIDVIYEEKNAHVYTFKV